jgi:putative DNA primase/helicase
VLLDVINALFPPGSYTSVEPQNWGHEYHRAKLAGTRINLVAELPKAEILASSHFKQIITGDLTSARHPYKEAFNFRPTAGHIFLANNLPTVNDHSYGFWRRQAILEFKHVFAGRNADSSLTDTIIKNELPGMNPAN